LEAAQNAPYESLLVKYVLVPLLYNIARYNEDGEKAGVARVAKA